MFKNEEKALILYKKKKNSYRQEGDKYGIICAMKAKQKNAKVENEVAVKLLRRYAILKE